MSVAPPTVFFSDRFARELPEMATSWQPEEVPDARLLVLNEPLAALLGLDPMWLHGPDGVRLLTGGLVPPDSRPVAQAYAGNQFGGPTSRLGDGRALLLGEILGVDGVLRDVHLKGSGRTPFARGGDGLAAVGPMLREHVISEAMHALGIPTTRSLAVTATGEKIYRETVLPGAVLTRIAASHLRVGSMQYARATGGDTDLLRRVADHAIARHYPDAAASPRPYLALLEAVTDAQAALIARWMLVGFVHGVMNTDNMTLSGETIDYGPCAFMEAYDPDTVYSLIDHGGRYAYGNQPSVGQWNLARLADALLPLIDDSQDQAVALAVGVLETFADRYRQYFVSGMRRKLGLPDDVDESVATSLIEELLTLMRAGHPDYTSFLRKLGGCARGDVEPARSEILDLAAFDDWLARWRALSPNAGMMDRANPIYIPRNHLVEEALTAATGGDMGPFERLLDVVTDPFTERDGLERYAAPAPQDFGAYQTFCGT